MLGKLLLSFMLIVGILNADIIDLNGNVKGIDISLKSEKSLIVGNNVFVVTLSKNGKQITNAKVKAKFFMPEMPGMPYMESKQRAKLKNGKYYMTINFAMSGTWQYKLYFKTSDGKKYKIRGSVNL